MKTMIVTGCASGIGKAAISFFNKHFYTIGIDVSDENIIDSNEFFNINCNNLNLLKKTLDHLSSVDVLINCAGVAGERGDITDIDPKFYVEAFNNNFISCLNLLKFTIPIMRSKKYGKIINMASITATKGLENSSAYASSKAAIIALSKVASAENAKYGIHINTISPATIDTPMISSLNKDSKDYSKVYPIKHSGNVMDVIYVMDMLIKNNFITGNDIIIDGGISNIINI